MDEVALLEHTLTKIEQHYELDPEQVNMYKNHILASEPNVYAIEIIIKKRFFKTQFTICVTKVKMPAAIIENIVCSRHKTRIILNRIKKLRAKYTKYYDNKQLKKEQETRIKSKDIIIDTVVDPIEEAFFTDKKDQ